MIEYVERASGESDFLLFGPGELRMTEERERDLLLEWRGSEPDIDLLALIDGELVGSLHFGAGIRPRTWGRQPRADRSVGTGDGRVSP